MEDFHDGKIGIDYDLNKKNHYWSPDNYLQSPLDHGCR